MGTINDGLTQIEHMLCDLTNTPASREDASISQRIEHVKAIIRSLYPPYHDIAFPIVICIEGLDKLGKTTQATLLARAMTESGVAASRLNEFDDTVSGPALRELLMREDIPSYLGVCFCSTAKVELYTSAMQTMLDEGVSVILDRGMLSTYAYGCGALDLSEEYVEHWTTLFFTKPDLTILFTGEQVSPTGSDKFEESDQTKIADAFKKYGELFDAVEFPVCGSIKKVHEELVALVNAAFGLTIKPLRDVS